MLGGRAAAHHFFRHNDAGTGDPVRLLVSLAAQLCLCVSGFEAALDVGAVDAALASRKLGDVFDSVLGAPLERVEAPARTMVVVLDALDELPPAQLGVVLS